jgi:hypothetical protein
MKGVSMANNRKLISGTEEDLLGLLGLPRDLLGDLISTHIRNLWRVDGLYFLGIESRFGTEAATQVDKECWASMAALEARDLGRIFSVAGKKREAVEKTLPFTSWYLDHPRKRFTKTAEELVFEVLECRTQMARLKKSLPVFPCRQVREGYLSRFAAEFGCECICEICPPGERDGEVWCRWRFREKS